MQTLSVLAAVPSWETVEEDFFSPKQRNSKLD